MKTPIPSTTRAQAPTANDNGNDSEAEHGPKGTLPKYQVMPPLSADDYAELEADIAQRGVLVPVEYDEDGEILDGHHRVRICETLGITDWPRIIRTGLSEPDKVAHARQLNFARRHLNREQKRALIAQQVRDRPQVSNRKIAESLGVTHPTVAAVRSKLVESGEVERFTTSAGASGGEYPTKRPKRSPGPPIKMRTGIGESIDDLASLSSAIGKLETSPISDVTRKNAIGLLKQLRDLTNAIDEFVGTLRSRLQKISSNKPGEVASRELH